MKFLSLLLLLVLAVSCGGKDSGSKSKKSGYRDSVTGEYVLKSSLSVTVQIDDESIYILDDAEKSIEKDGYECSFSVERSSFNYRLYADRLVMEGETGVVEFISKQGETDSIFGSWMGPQMGGEDITINWTAKISKSKMTIDFECRY